MLPRGISELATALMVHFIWLVHLRCSYYSEKMTPGTVKSGDFVGMHKIPPDHIRLFGIGGSSKAELYGPVLDV